MAEGVRISIVADGMAQFSREFSRMDAKFEDLTPIWPDVRGFFWEIQGEQFDSQGSKGGGGKWKALSKRYAIQKIARYGSGKKILEGTGALRDSLTGDAEGSYFSSSKTEVAIGTTIPYGIYHHRGMGNNPKREIISFSDRQQTDMMKVIQTGLIRELRKGNGFIDVRDRDF